MGKVGVTRFLVAVGGPFVLGAHSAQAQLPNLSTSPSSPQAQATHRPMTRAGVEAQAQLHLPSAPADIDAGKIWIQGYLVVPDQPILAGGGLVAVPASQAIADLNGRCLYELSYELRNTGGTATRPFGVAIKMIGPGSVQPQGKFALAPGGSQLVKTRGWFVPGDQQVVITVDPSDAVPEQESTFSNWDGSRANDNNDYGFSVHVLGQCHGKEMQLKLPVQGVQPTTPLNARTTPQAGCQDGKQSEAAIIINYRRALEQRLGAAASGIWARVCGGTLTIGGRVATPTLRTQAEDVARSIGGISQVNNLVLAGRVP